MHGPIFGLLKIRSSEIEFDAPSAVLAADTVHECPLLQLYVSLSFSNDEEAAFFGAGLTTFLMDGNASQTVFAPVNSAWQRQPSSSSGTDNTRALTDLMLFHVALGTFPCSSPQTRHLMHASSRFVR